MSAFLIGKSAPDFVVQAVVDGEETTISLKDYLGKYVVLFFYPKDFTYVCPTSYTRFKRLWKLFRSVGL